jgi:hypothetical protein
VRRVFESLAPHDVVVPSELGRGLRDGRCAIESRPGSRNRAAGYRAQALRAARCSEQRRGAQRPDRGQAVLSSSTPWLDSVRKATGRVGRRHREKPRKTSSSQSFWMRSLDGSANAA